MSLMPIDQLLPTLQKVKPVKTGQWIACCPAHDDRTPSLKITETSNGVVLLKCWAGCTASEIVTAVGLGLRDLFPLMSNKPRRNGLSLQAIKHEQWVLKIGTAHLEQGRTLSETDLARLELARRRLGDSA